jgi:NitT/TauT family transport system permease protein
MSKQTFSNSHRKFLKKQKQKRTLILFSQVFLLVSLIALWELVTYTNLVDSFIFSSPSRIVKTTSLLYKSGDLFYHIGVTLLEAIAGFLLATFLGVFIAIILWWNETLRKILDPYIVVLNSLPKVALGPMIIIWFGANANSIIAMAVLIVIIITILNMLNSFNSCSKDKILLMKSMNATKLQILLKLILPNSMPKFVSTLKINVGLSWVGVIMGEYLVSRAGLGYLINYGRQVFNLDLVMTSTVILCTLAGVMYAVVVFIEKRIVKHN